MANVETFKSLQEDLNKIEKSINFVETRDFQKERINQDLDNIMRRIDDLTGNEVDKLEAWEVLILQQQIDRIKLKVGIETTTQLYSLKKWVVTKSPVLAGRPPEVQKNIQASAENVVHIANGEDQNSIARWMQQWMKKLLS